MRIYFLLAAALMINLCQGQTIKSKYIKLPKGGFVLYENFVQIGGLVDARADTNILGKITIYNTNKEAFVRLENGNAKTIAKMLTDATRFAQPNSFDIYVRIDELRIFDYGTRMVKFGVCELTLSFFTSADMTGSPLYVNKTTITDQSNDIDATHGRRLMRAFQALLMDLNHRGLENLKSGKYFEPDYLPLDKNNLPVFTVYEEAIVGLTEQGTKEIQDSIVRYENRKPGTRNVFAIGYQIGGFTMIGFENEFRINNLLGVNVGFGFSGITGGIKIHTSHSKNSLFIYPNYKDGGFGQFGSLNLEIGGRIPFSPLQRGAFHLQGGFGRINYVSPEVSARLNDVQAGNITLVFGVGFSW